MSTPSIHSVDGGSHGIVAGYASMLGLASTCEEKALAMGLRAALGVCVMSDGDLLESAVLSPVTFAAAEGQVLAATGGFDGLTTRALGLEGDALAVRGVVTAFKASDALARTVSEKLDHAVGQAAPALLLPGGAIAWAYYKTLSPGEQEEFMADVSDLLADHPEMAQHLINGGGGMLQTLLAPGPGASAPLGWLNPADGPLHQATTGDAARLLAFAFGNDTEFVHEFVDADKDQGARSRVPGSVEDLMQQLALTNDMKSGKTPLDGAIQIQQFGEGDDERYVVYVPGTDDMNPMPGVPRIVRDMLTNYQLIGGLDSAYGRGIHQALLDAGLKGKDVMLVGHSQGGMVSTSLAADPRFAADFDIKHVVTAGSPTAQVADVPAGTHALHLENRGDLVPALDGEDNPDQPHRTTVVFDDGDHGVKGNHSLERYQAGAAAVDASDHGSIQTHLDKMVEDGFLREGEKGKVSTVVIRRP
jgi:hypothetical protein